MKAIGGYFELADQVDSNSFPHENGILLNTGRNALEYILRSIGKIKHIYIPYFTCEVVLEPIKRLAIPYSFYHITSRFEIADKILPEKDEYIIANNYYGIKDLYIRSLAAKYGEHLIVDCAQAFFSPVISQVKSFYSSRKFVGVADGGIAYLGNINGLNINSFEEEPTELHSTHLFIRKERGAEAGFNDYRLDEEALDNQPIRRMSLFTKGILANIDYVKVKNRRIANWKILDHELASSNLIQTPLVSDFECPMVYPYAIEKGKQLRQWLIKNKIFVAKYWPNVIPFDVFDFEANLSDKVVALPIDQRYTEDDMRYIIETIKNF